MNFNKNENGNSSKDRANSSNGLNIEETSLVSDKSRLDTLTPSSPGRKTVKWFSPTNKKGNSCSNMNIIRKKATVNGIVKSKIVAKPPLAYKGYMSKKIHLKEGIEYICRLENNLSVADVNKRFHLLNESKITCSNNTIIECIKNPKVTVRDIYDKITYDSIRRNVEHDIKPIFLGRKTKGQIDEKEKLNKKNDEEIMRMHFGERKYKDWVSFNKVHDFTVTKNVRQTEEIKSNAI